MQKFSAKNSEVPDNMRTFIELVYYEERYDGNAKGRLNVTHVRAWCYEDDEGRFVKLVYPEKTISEIEPTTS